MMDGGMGGCKLQRVTFDVDLVGSLLLPGCVKPACVCLLATPAYSVPTT